MRDDFAVYAIDDATIALVRKSDLEWLLVIGRLLQGETPIADATRFVQLPRDGRWTPVLHTNERRFGGSVDLAVDVDDSHMMQGPGAVVLRATRRS